MVFSRKIDERPPPNAAREAQLAELLNRIAEEAAHGSEPSLTETIKQHPEFERDLRELWGTVMLASARGPRCRTN